MDHIIPGPKAVAECVREDAVGKRAQSFTGIRPPTLPCKAWAASLRPSAAKQAARGGLPGAAATIRVDQAGVAIHQKVEVGVEDLQCRSRRELALRPYKTRLSAGSSQLTMLVLRLTWHAGLVSPPPGSLVCCQKSLMFSSSCTDHCDFFFFSDSSGSPLTIHWH